ncbi:MAG: DUF6438 domain-containing protein [Flavobacteriales bacterium]
MKHTILLAIAALAIACGGNKKTTAAEPEQQVQTDEVAQAPRLGGPGKADTLFLSLERTPCFGMCKAYQINLYRSGYATFDGRMNMEKEGLHSARVGLDTMLTILARADELGFFGMQAKYDAEVTDLPSTVLRIIADDRDKKVIGRVGQPQAFKALVADIESLLLPMAWVPVTPEP